MSFNSRPIEEFPCLRHARAYLESIRGRVVRLRADTLVDALQRAELAYFRFPELLTQIPRRKLIEGVEAGGHIAGFDAMVLLLYCIAMVPASVSSLGALFRAIDKGNSWQSFLPVLRFVFHSHQVSWSAIKPIIEHLQQNNERQIILKLISAILANLDFGVEGIPVELGTLLRYLLDLEPTAGIDGHALAITVIAARHRLSSPLPDTSEQGFRPELLALAEYFRRMGWASGINATVDKAWPTGWLSFHEFLLQWPCQIELPIDVDGAAFIIEAYRSILLRDPESTELEQYLRLQREGASKLWILEDLLASAELRSLDRNVCVVLGPQVITCPLISGEKIPTVTWSCEKPA